MRAVLDTNVLVSGLIAAATAPGRIVDLVRGARLQLAVDDRILAEYEDVLNRDYLRRYFAASEARNVMEFLRYGSHRQLSAVFVPDLPDPDDVPFLEIAISAQCPLVTGNGRHYPGRARQGCLVLTPREFLDRFGSACADSPPAPSLP